ncbi:MAG: hypothetical protein LQ350_001352 [Teloschistes chrysophthalmus]|nr:MAG: hypothetical protein LQ350_001352 [Niorma chrysophthalma]
MSTGGLSAQALTALGNDGASVAMRWLEMLLPDSQEVKAGLPAYSLRVIEDPANKVVRMVTDPLNLISVMGPARSGKSTLMNLLAGCKVSELFPTYPGMETFTKGIYIPTRMLSLPDFSALEGDPPVQASDANIKVTFVDTEGQGAVGTSYDMSLFSPALISSRVVIYNRTGGLLVEEIINQLGMMTQAAQRLRVASDDSSGPVFGHLFIMFNQFRLNKTDTAATLQATLINDEKATDASSQNRNAIRALLRSAFESIQVYILPDQLKEESRDALADGTKSFLLLDDFRPKYLEYFKILRAGLSQALVKPRQLTKGVPLTGGALADFMPQFAAAINKAEPLNIPSIFEAAQNGAINKAINTFSASLGKSLDARLAEDPRPTVMLGNLIEGDITLLLTQLASTLSYMPRATVQKAQDEARGQSATPKSSALTVNLTRVKGVMATKLNTSITSMGTSVDALFQNSAGQVTAAEAEGQLSNIESQNVASFQQSGNYYDPQSFPNGWRQAFTDALANLKPSAWARIKTAWAQYVSKVKTAKMQALTDSLITLGEQKAAGEGNAYANEALTRTQTVIGEFNDTMDQGYRWTDKDDQKTQFATAAENSAKTRRALWEQNDTAVRAQLTALTQRLELQYDIKLQDALVPQVEPAAYSTITDDADLKIQLTTFLSSNKISTTLTNETLLQYQGAISFKKSSYNTTNEYRDYLQREFSLQVPLFLSQYRTDIDLIELNLASSALTRTSVSVHCDGLQTQARQKFTLLISTLGVRPGGSVSTSVVQTYSAQLEDGLKLGKSQKVDKYDELVGMYNKTLLAGVATPVIDKALANSYANDGALNGDVDNAKATFVARARGDGGDRDAKWNDWYTNVYPLVLDTVRRYNAYTTPGLDGNKAATKEIQTAVIRKIYGNVVDMGAILGMSYINSSQWNLDAIEDMGMTQPDPMKPGYQASRTLRLNNPFKGTKDDYDWQHSTNLVFADWSVEISDIVWGRPIITDLKPSKIDTTEYPAQPTVLVFILLLTRQPSDNPLTNAPRGTVTVGANGTETSTITDSFTWGVSGGLEATMVEGVKDVWQNSIKTTFNANMSTTNTKTATTTYSTSISTQLALPANRTNVVSQMVFDQRTSLPYTAKVRVVPKLRLENGFTKWGGGGTYQTNPNTSALKAKCRQGGRNYGEQSFGRCDQIQADARADADPWEWQLAMQRNPSLVGTLAYLASAQPYEVYVKGKWEGITGKYSVTTVTPKTTSLGLMPNI